MNLGSMVKRLRHRPFTAVTGVQIPLESLKIIKNEIFLWLDSVIWCIIHQGSVICRCGSIGRAADL